MGIRGPALLHHFGSKKRLYAEALAGIVASLEPILAPQDEAGDREGLGRHAVSPRFTPSACSAAAVRAAREAIGARGRTRQTRSAACSASTLSGRSACLSIPSTRAACSNTSCVSAAPSSRYTSGTTGSSKGVFSSYMHAWSAAGPEAWHQVRDDDRHLVHMPIYRTPARRALAPGLAKSRRRTAPRFTEMPGIGLLVAVYLAFSPVEFPAFSRRMSCRTRCRLRSANWT